jgi:Domain of unknown function (DUF4190)
MLVIGRTLTHPDSRSNRSTVDSRDISTLILVGGLGTFGIIMVIRAIVLREKDYRFWLASHRATAAVPLTDAASLRAQWKLDRSARDLARREAVYRQQHPSLQASADTGGELPPLPPDASLRTNTWAVLSFVFSLLGGLLGIAFGHIALSQLKGTSDGGRGLAIAGLVLGYAWLGVYVLIGVLFLVVAITRPGG